jgi:hypothetical protein
MVVMVILSVRNYLKMKKILKSRKDEQIKKLESDIEMNIPKEEANVSKNILDVENKRKLSEAKLKESKCQSSSEYRTDNDNEDSLNSLSTKEESDNSSSNELSTNFDKLSLIETKEEMPSSFLLLWEKKFIICLIILSISIMVFANLLKGTKDRPSILNLTYCSPLSVGLYIICLLPLALIGIYAFKKLINRQKSCGTNQKETFSANLAVKVALASITGGFISTVGVSGSLFISASLILLNIEPIVVKCTLSILILFLSSINSLQFFLMGYFDWKNILFIGCSALVGCLIANFVIKVQLAKGDTSTVNSIIAVQCFVMTVVICFAVPSSSYYEYLTNTNFFSMGEFC